MPPTLPVQAPGCTLPPFPELPTPAFVPVQMDNERQASCFDPENTALLVMRDVRLRRWAREVVARCGVLPDSTKTANDGGAN